MYLWFSICWVSKNYRISSSGNAHAFQAPSNGRVAFAYQARYEQETPFLSTPSSCALLMLVLACGSFMCERLQAQTQSDQLMWQQRVDAHPQFGTEHCKFPNSFVASQHLSHNIRSTEQFGTTAQRFARQRVRRICELRRKYRWTIVARIVKAKPMLIIALIVKAKLNPQTRITLWTTRLYQSSHALLRPTAMCWMDVRRRKCVWLSFGTHVQIMRSP